MPKFPAIVKNIESQGDGVYVHLRQKVENEGLIGRLKKRIQPELHFKLETNPGWDKGDEIQVELEKK